MIETVDISVVDNLPTVLQLIAQCGANHHFTGAYQAEALTHPKHVIQEYSYSRLEDQPNSSRARLRTTLDDSMILPARLTADRP